MLRSFGPRAILALSLAVVAAALCFAMTLSVEAALIVLVTGIVAVLVALGPTASSTDEAGKDESVSETPGALPAEELIEAIIEPVLVIAHHHVAMANSAARALLGQHILGEDVRLAIRHPAAAERLLNPQATLPASPIHLVGLGTRDQRWEMRIHSVSGDRQVVHLIDRSGSYATERMRVDFVANASHELRTPLASLIGYAETLGEEAGDDPDVRARFLKIMSDEARRMQRLIDDLMSLSRIEAEKYRAPDQSVDLIALVEEVRTELCATARERAADLMTDVADVPPVRGDRAQLSQLLHNIIGNAMKYGRPGTPVKVVLRPDGDAMARIAVSDEGEGIAAEHIPRLTERFYRVDSGRSRALGGTGLGLAIVRHVVERHRGRLDIASTVGKGTTVTVLLPFASQPSPTSRPSS